MTRHPNEQVEAWLNDALDAHQDQDRYTMIRPAHVVDLLLELRHHRAAADEAAWDSETEHHGEMYDPQGGPLCAFHQAQADAETEAQVNAAEAETLDGPPFQTELNDYLDIPDMPQDDGLVWETTTGHTIQWEGDVGMWHLRHYGEETGGRWTTDSLPGQLRDEDYPITLQGEPTPHQCATPAPYQFSKSTLLHALREAEAASLRSGRPSLFEIADNGEEVTLRTFSIDSLTATINRQIRGEA